MEWPYPFLEIEHADDKPALEAELRKEVKPRSSPVWTPSRGNRATI